MIAIDFQGGAHGNFLEFVCNVVAGVKTNTLPFNSAGASHSKVYSSLKVFTANHYSFNNLPINTNKVVAIKISEDDLLPLTQISLLRAGDYGYDNNILELDTYNKLNNKNYRWVLDALITSFFEGQIQQSYNRVKDESWPDIDSLEKFNALPEKIKIECITVHNLKLLELNEQHPHCPRNVLREFFQIGFENPSQQGFMTQQLKMIYAPNIDVYEFQFNNFYSKEKFLDSIKNIAEWSKISYHNWYRIAELHQAFLERQPFHQSKTKCDKIVSQLIANKIMPPSVDMLEEAYINAKLKSQGHECRY